MIKLVHLLTIGTLFLSQTIFANPQSGNRIEELHHSPNGQLTIKRACQQKSVLESVCTFSFQVKNKAPEILMPETGEYEDYIKWMDNTAYLHLGSCGSPCRINAFVNDQGQVDTFINLIAVDENRQCVAYPDENGIVFRKLFSEKTSTILEYKKNPGLEGPAQLAMIDGDFDKDGNIVLSYYSTEVQDSDGENTDEGRDVATPVLNPCQK